jgi:hypothetical protein
MPRHSSYNPGQMANDTLMRYSGTARWHETPVPGNYQRVFELRTLHDVSSTMWPPVASEIEDDTELHTGMLIMATGVGQPSASGVTAKLWVYCGRRLWLPVSGVLQPCEPISGVGTTLRQAIAAAAAGWIMLAPVTRAQLACIDGVRDLLPHYWQAGGSRIDMGNAIEHILSCADYLPTGRGGVLQLATWLAQLHQTGQTETLTRYFLSSAAMSYLADTVDPRQRQPLLASFAERLGLRLNATRQPPKQQAGPKINARRLISSKSHGKNQQSIEP